MKGIFITGSDTNVGKTYIGCHIASELNARGINVIPRKPIETGCELIDKVLHPSDANLLLQASKSNLSLDEVCPNRFAPAISPQIAAQKANQHISLNQLATSCTDKLQHDDFLLVEGAGGFFSPICEQALNADLAAELKLPVILVVDDRLGAINQALLAIHAIEKYQLEISAVVLNTHKLSNQSKQIDNATEIKYFIDYPVYQVSYNLGIAPEFFSLLINT